MSSWLLIPRRLHKSRRGAVIKGDEMPMLCGYCSERYEPILCQRYTSMYSFPQSGCIPYAPLTKEFSTKLSSGRNPRL